MSNFSKKEHLLLFRKSYNGPLIFDKGDLFWSKVSCKVENFTEYFVLCLDEYHPSYKKLAKEYKKIYLEDWDGTFLIPCNYVVFADTDLENERRVEREGQLAEWRSSSNDC